MEGERWANKLLSAWSNRTMALTRLKSQRPCRRDATRRSRATAPGFPGNSSVTHHQQRQGKQGKQSRPRLDLRDPRLGKAQLPFGIAKPFLTAKPPGILRGRRLSPAQAIGNQVPGVPLPVAVARAAQSQPQVMGGTLTIGPAPQVALAGSA